MIKRILIAHHVAAYAVVVILRGCFGSCLRCKVRFIDNFFGEFVTECVNLFSLCLRAVFALVGLFAVLCACCGSFGNKFKVVFKLVD